MFSKHQDLNNARPNLTNVRNFHPLKDVGRGRNTQLHVGVNLNHITLRINNSLMVCVNIT